MTTVTYSVSYPLVANPPSVSGHTLRRPWAALTLHHASVSRRIWSLVDTGADDCVMDLGVAALLGINLNALPTVVLSTAGGRAQFWRHPQMHVELAGKSASADVLFGVVSVPLLGRSALLALVEAGFDTTAWHHT